MPVRDINKKRPTAVYRMPKELNWGQKDLVGRWEGSLWKPSSESTQPAHFSVTGETWIPGRSDFESGGCLHKELERMGALALLQGHDAILPSLVKWHLFDVKNGPMHYVENAIFHYTTYLRHEGVLPPGVHPWDAPREEDKNAFQYFKSGILFGVLDDDVVPELPPLPRAPDRSDAWVYDAETAEARHVAWVKTGKKLVRDTLTPWLTGRLPRLMALFEADMVRWFGSEILEAPEENNSR